MSLKIVPYKAEHAVAIICRQPRESWLRINDKAEERAKYLETAGPALTGKWCGELVGVGGLMFNGPWNGVAEAWLLFGEKIDRFPITTRMTFAREIKNRLGQWIEQYQLVRVEANIRAGFVIGVRFAEFVGLKYESTKLHYYPSGEAGLVYVKIIERR